MSFTEKQLQALQRNVAPRNIRTRAIGGKELAYVEGWYAISAANRIFGFDGWDRETVETRCVLARETRGSSVAVYTARVRVAVRAGERTIVRDGHGTGEGRGTLVGEAHDLALKAAETDATKRALVTFGKGLWIGALCQWSRQAGNETGCDTTRSGRRRNCERGGGLHSRGPLRRPRR
jgi:recombination DNA repair RAD52 pathway protein